MYVIIIIIFIIIFLVEKVELIIKRIGSVSKCIYSWINCGYNCQSTRELSEMEWFSESIR